MISTRNPATLAAILGLASLAAPSAATAQLQWVATGVVGAGTRASAGELGGAATWSSFLIEARYRNAARFESSSTHHVELLVGLGRAS